MILLVALAALTTFSLSAMQHVVSLSNATVSPDGSRIAFVASRVDSEHNRYDDTLELYDLRASAMHALSGSHRSVNQLAWSPDGMQLAAVMDDAKHDVSQLFLVNPVTGAAQQLTYGKSSIVQIAWDPHGKRIAFSRRDDAPSKKGAAAYQDGFRVDDNAYLDEEPARPSQIWLVGEHGHAQRLTRGPESVMNSPLSWSPDSGFIVYERGPAVHGLNDHAYVARLDVRTGQSIVATHYHSYQDQALYSPGGLHIAYLYPHAGDPVNQSEAWLANSDGTDSHDISSQLDRQVSSLAWMPHNAGLLLQIDDRTRQPLVQLSFGGRTRQLPLGPVVSASIQSQGSVARNGTIVFIGDEAQRPDELFVLYANAAAPKRLTSFNDGIARLQLSRQTRVMWTLEGFQEDGVLTYPPGYVAGRRYPLVLRIHGGPYESSLTAFSSFYQLAASHGYLVFAPNYRGSTDLGNAYVRAIFNDPNSGPARDIMAGIAAVKKLGIVDESKVAISGWSYGGELTSWLEGHYDGWRAAVAGAAVNDLVVDYSIADDIDADRLVFSQPSPFQGNALPLWRRESPVTYFQKIHTPTLILCNVYDVRVPIVESYEMYRALRDNNVPVEFYAYPTSGHLPHGPVREMDAYRHWLAWFDRYLK